MAIPKKGNRRRSRSPPKAKAKKQPPPVKGGAKPEESSKQDSQESKKEGQLPQELQQLVLDIFKASFSERFGTDLTALLQQIKGHLYNRDFLQAFGRDDYLEAYAIRWSPSRALAYLQIFHEVVSDILKTEDRNVKVACLGGGAGAELVALGGYIKALSSSLGGKEGGEAIISLSLVDIANWGTLLSNLRDQMTVPPTLSKYAAAHVKAANAALTSPSSLQYTFHRQDMLGENPEQLATAIKDAQLVTIFFTLNELFTTSISKTKAFLLLLGDIILPGGYLLVVDSAGSYATVTLNESETNYPMQWLLDHTLQIPDPKDDDPPKKRLKWEKVQCVESQWFRIPHALKYPLELENMRYQLHLYKRFGRRDGGLKPTTHCALNSQITYQ